MPTLLKVATSMLTPTPNYRTYQYPLLSLPVNTGDFRCQCADYSFVGDDLAKIQGSLTNVPYTN